MGGCHTASSASAVIIRRLRKRWCWNILLYKKELDFFLKKRKTSPRLVFQDDRKEKRMRSKKKMTPWTQLGKGIPTAFRGGRHTMAICSRSYLQEINNLEKK